MCTLEPENDTHTECHPPLQPKGSLISTILCNVYYGHVERTVFPDILRVVDRDRDDWARAAAAAAAATVVAEDAAAVAGRSGIGNCGGRRQGEEGGEGEEGEEGVGRVDVSGHHNFSSSSSSSSSSSTSFSASSSSLSSLFTGGATRVGSASEDEVPDAALARLTDDFLLLTTDRTLSPASFLALNTMGILTQHLSLICRCARESSNMKRVNTFLPFFQVRRRWHLCSACTVESPTMAVV